MRTSLCLLALIAGGVANAVNVSFDDLTSDEALTNQYSGLGLDSTGTSYIRDGLGLGDSGNWGLFGTNGTKFLGNNGDPDYTTVFNFSVAVNAISFDISRSNGSDVNDSYVVRVYNGATLVGGGGFFFQDINNWSTFSASAANITRVEVKTLGADFHPYGIDNFTYGVVPEPVSMATLALGGLALLKRRRKA